MKTSAYHIILLGCLFAMLASQEAAAQNAQPGWIVGHIDGISKDGDHYFLLGWACQQGQSKSIDVQLFAEKEANGLSKPGPLFAETANLFSEPGVARVCRDSGGGKHRFIVVLPYGLGPESNLTNRLITNHASFNRQPGRLEIVVTYRKHAPAAALNRQLSSILCRVRFIYS
jgi:hypothetical protein